MEHVMVTPGYPPVRIGDGPTIEARSDAYRGWHTNGAGPELIINGVTVVTIDWPYPLPVPIDGTPYEAYALGHWSLNVFAIRLRPDTTTPSSNQDDEPAACIRRSGICWPIDSAIEAAFNAAKGQQL